MTTPHPAALAALLVALLLLAAYGIAVGRDLRIEGAGFSFAVTAPPEIEGEHERTDTGWTVTGPAVIRATSVSGTIRELVVPTGETRRVRVREDSVGLTLEVQR